MAREEQELAYLTRQELTERGWSKSMLRNHPADLHRGEQELWTMELVQAVEQEPGMQAILAQVQKSQEETNALRQVPKKQIPELLAKAAAMMTEAVQQALEHSDFRQELAEDVVVLVRHCHGQVMAPVTVQKALDLEKRPRLRPSAEELRGLYRKSWSVHALRSGGIRQMSRHRWILAFLPEGEKLAEKYAANLMRFAVRAAEELQSIEPAVSAEEILSVPRIQEQFPGRRPSLKENYNLFYVQGMIQMKLERLLAVEPKDEYPQARAMERHFVIHVGETNTGKTYQGLKRLQEVWTGAYLAPLRLLALEVQERLLAAGVRCSMRTGEEEEIVPNETHVSSTVEKADLHTHYDVAVIDECQMIADPFRGFAWTRAILGLQADEIHLCTAPEALPLLKKILEDLGDPYEVVEHHRSVPLIWQEEPVNFRQVEQGDALIAFSKREVLKMAARLRNMDIPTSIIYGAMPYEARRAQMHQFLSGETKVLVATDAIGMGLNLPVRRILFTEAEKFDGRGRRLLTPPEVKQIAGRAGRMGLYEKGYVAAMRDADEEGYLHQCLQKPNTPIPHAVLGFSDLVASLDFPLVDVLKAWSSQPVKLPYERMDVSRHIRLITMMEKAVPAAKNLPREEILRACGIPFDETREALLRQFLVYTDAYCSGQTDELDRPILMGEQLDDLELYFKQLELYYSFSKAFRYPYDETWLRAEKMITSDAIHQLLSNDLEKCGPRCRICGRPLPLDSAFGVCDRCFRRRRDRAERNQKPGQK